MSSDDDGLDEDELLQMALKEQAQRDLNYQKPSQSTVKPVRNYVQSPQNRAAAAVAPAKKKAMNQQRKMSIDEDEDSDVELLSISSGDEDDRGGGGFPTRNRAASGKVDDRWDGGEPNTWKRVDEAEEFLGYGEANSGT